MKWTQIFGGLVAATLWACGSSPVPVEPTDAGTSDAGIEDPDAGDPVRPSFTDHQLGGPRADELLDIVLTADALHVAGYRNGTVGVDRVDPSGDAVGFVQTFSRSGEPLKEYVFNTPGADVVDAIAVSGGQLVVTGRTSGAFPGFTNAGQNDAFVGWIGLDGSSTPPRLQFGDERPQHPTRIAVAADGSLLIAGYEDVYVPSNYVEAWEDGLTARVQAQVKPITLDWKRFDTESPDVVLGLAPAASGDDQFLCGQIMSGSFSGAFVRRVAASGETVWNVELSGVEVDFASAVMLGPDGTLYVGGTTFLTLGPTQYGQQDMFVAVLDSETGEVLQTMQAGTAESDSVRDLAIDADGNVWVAGGTVGSFPGFTFGGTYDAALVRFAPDGSWSAWQHGTAGWDEVSALEVDENGAYLVGQTEGGFVTDAEFGGVRDGFLVRVTPEQLKAP